MIILFAIGIWHATIGALLFTHYYGQTITPHTHWIWIDRYVLFSIMFIHIFMNLIFIIYHYHGPFKHRRNIERKDVEYRRQILGLDQIINTTISII